MIGREQKRGGKTLQVPERPGDRLFPVGLQNQFEYEPAPSMPPRAEGSPSTVVLQAVWPAEIGVPRSLGVPTRSMWSVQQGRNRMPIYVYNSAKTEVKGRLSVVGPKDWNLAISQDATVRPLGRVELALTYDLSRAARGREVVKIEGDFGLAGRSRLSTSLSRVPGGLFALCSIAIQRTESNRTADPLHR